MDLGDRLGIDTIPFHGNPRFSGGHHEIVKAHGEAVRNLAGYHGLNALE
jgi:hypothetical protein